MGHHLEYPEEFRQESVRLILTTDKSMAEVSRDLGINCETLGNWVRADLARQKRDQAPEALSESERAELKRVKNENAELRIEQEILRWAAAFLSRRRSGDSEPVVSDHAGIYGAQAALWEPAHLSIWLLWRKEPSGLSLCRARRAPGRSHQLDPPKLMDDLWPSSGSRGDQAPRRALRQEASRSPHGRQGSRWRSRTTPVASGSTRCRSGARSRQPGLHGHTARREAHSSVRPKSDRRIQSVVSTPCWCLTTEPPSSESPDHLAPQATVLTLPPSSHSGPRSRVISTGLRGGDLAIEEPASLCDLRLHRRPQQLAARPVEPWLPFSSRLRISRCRFETCVRERVATPSLQQTRRAP